MLFASAVLEGIANGTVDLAFRRWASPRVRPGSELRTAVGVVRVRSIEPVADTSITDRDARRAGFDSRMDLIASLRRGPGTIHRIALALAGPDPRVQLRNTPLSRNDRMSVVARLARMDTVSDTGPWTMQTLELIRENPGVRAADTLTTRRPAHRR